MPDGDIVFFISVDKILRRTIIKFKCADIIFVVLCPVEFIESSGFIAAVMAASVEASKRMRLQAGSSPWDAFLKKAAEMQELDTECSADGGYGA